MSEKKLDSYYELLNTLHTLRKGFSQLIVVVFLAITALVTVSLLTSPKNNQSTHALASQATSANILQNSGFENGGQNWTTSGDGKLFIDTSVHHSDSSSLKLDFSKTRDGGVIQYFPVNGATTYKISGWIKTSAEAKSVNISLGWYSKLTSTPVWGDIIDPFGTGSRTIGKINGLSDWKYYEGTFVAPINAKMGSVTTGGSNSNGFAWFDDLSVMSLLSIDSITPTAVPSLPGPRPTITKEPTPTPSQTITPSPTLTRTPTPTPIITPTPSPSPSGNIIYLDSSQHYQSIIGWESTGVGPVNDPNYKVYRDSLFNMAMDLGINRVRVEIVKSSSGSEFDLNALDTQLDQVKIFRDKIQQNGEKLWINICVVGNGFANDPSGYASAALNLMQHMKTKYGFIPDSWEIALEPSTFGWSITQVENALINTGDIFLANKASFTSNASWQPYFVAPSDIGPNVANYNFGVMWNDSNAIKQAKIRSYLKELSFHTYCNCPLSDKVAIGNRVINNNIRSSMLEKIKATYGELHEDLKVAQVSAWQQYTMLWANGDNGEHYFYTLNSADMIPKIETRAKFLRQYFKYVRKGAVRIGASSGAATLDPVAFINSNGKYVVVVKATGSSSFSVKNLPSGMYGIFYTTNSQYSLSLSDQSLNPGQLLQSSIPNAGVITIYQK